ncbi:M24 family metallopeptidase [Methanosphaerula palustris]|uniref:Peptidase M24 n=1 Tax=Methanosphaerula palustris (strain ATCC BAA-1556 / DSM 19958 / E1-9c) TaxID=521011 RepID=B8GF49_METPE|nr:Xaa-Pro peptidase family protein [Methanosphaerula palustris]ACL17855.1 peptidase M24 [Methanosphaerula palustris E1-9c]
MKLLDMMTEQSGAAAYVGYGSSLDPDMRYLTRFSCTDPVVYLKRRGEQGQIVVSQMEYGRAMQESAFLPVTRSEAGLLEILKEEPDHWKAMATMISRLAGGNLLVSPTFPAGLYAPLSSLCTVVVDDQTVERMRAVKSEEEIACIRMVQQATEASMKTARRMIRRAKVKKGVLQRGGEPLTAELVRQAIHTALQKYGCTGAETIVSCGPDSALPHHAGAGPLLAGEPIVIDIFPKSDTTGYYADMTRTYVKGEADPAIMEMYTAVRDAKAAGLGAIRAGAEGAAVHRVAVDLFAERGYATGTTGFTHNLGHGVGLAVHELPTLGPSGGPLGAGEVVTVEPGLYFPGIGGVRLEDLCVVRPDCAENLTRCKEEMIL